MHYLLSELVLILRYQSLNGSMGRFLLFFGGNNRLMRSLLARRVLSRHRFRPLIHLRAGSMPHTSMVMILRDNFFSFFFLSSVDIHGCDCKQWIQIAHKLRFTLCNGYFKALGRRRCCCLIRCPRCCCCCCCLGPSLSALFSHHSWIAGLFSHKKFYITCKLKY